ncbi:MAG: hypothetical protein JJE51_14710 [Thermoanaerobaculia bacterium]|nr:hypothetical protein [Thermoanaerobaculia bacterium]
MKTKKFLIAFLVVAAMVNCRGRETAVTGGYGDGVVVGEVVMGESVALSSPAGLEVSVVGTGMAMTVGGDGRFMFTGVPQKAELQFRRASDGIDARLAVTSSSMLVEVNRTSAQARKPARTKVEQYEGLIQKVDGTSIDVYTSKKQTKTIDVLATTVIRKGNVTYTVDQLKVGWRVHVKATVKNNTITALEIMVQNTNGDDEGEEDDDEGEDGNEGATMTANGRVNAVNGTDLLVQSQPKGEVTVKTDANTEIKMQGKRVQVSDIKVGWEVNTQGTRVDDHTLLARKIEVRGNSKK